MPEHEDRSSIALEVDEHGRIRLFVSAARYGVCVQLAPCDADMLGRALCQAADEAAAAMIRREAGR